MARGLFDILNVLSRDKNCSYEEIEKEYSAYMVNRFLAMDDATINIANEMNKAGKLPKDLQYDFYFHIIPPKRRFFKYVKARKDEDIDIIAQHFNVNKELAKMYYNLLNQRSLDLIKKKYQ